MCIRDSWVQIYADPAFEEIVRLLERLLDEQTDDTLVMRAAYRRAMRVELAFCEAALKPKD